MSRCSCVPLNAGRKQTHCVMHYSPVSMVLWFDSVSRWKLRKQRSVPPFGPSNLKTNSRSLNFSLAMAKYLRFSVLRIFGHIARSSPDEDHHRANAAAIRKPPPDWRRPARRSSHTWLRSVEADLRPLNIGLSSAWSKASGRADWRHIMDTATLWKSTP